MEQILKERFDRMIDRHFRFEAEDDVEGVLSTMVPEVEHDVVGSPTGPLHGRQQARGPSWDYPVGQEEAGKLHKVEVVASSGSAPYASKMTSACRRRASAGMRMVGMVVLTAGCFYCNPKGNVHGPAVAHEETIVIEVYDGPHYPEKPSWYTDERDAH